MTDAHFLALPVMSDQLAQSQQLLGPGDEPCLTELVIIEAKPPQYQRP